MPVQAAILTAYCACALCCGTADRLTSAGTIPKAGFTIAAPRNVALGTRVVVRGVWAQPKIFVVEDRTAKRFDGRWDVFMASHWEARKFGIKGGSIEIIK